MRPRSVAGGFTLTELLLAVGIAVTVLALTFALYFAARRTADEQVRRRGDTPAILLALDQITRDLTSLQPAPGHDAGGLELVTEAGLRGPASTFTFIRSRPARAEGLPEDLRWTELIEIQLRLESVPGQPGRLIRTERPLTGPGSLADPVPAILASGVDGLEIRLRRGQDWQDQWKVEADADLEEWPQAARVTLWPEPNRRDHQSRSVDVFIPTGWKVEPTTP